MPARGFGFKTVTGTAQPVFGTTTTTIAVPTPDQYTGRMDPASNRSTVQVTVTDVSYFRKGDRVMLGISDSFLVFPPVGTLPPDSAQVIAIAGSVLTLQGLTRRHEIGEFIVLSIPCARIKIQAGSGNTGELYIGEDPTVSVTSTTLIDQVDPSAGRTFDIGSSASGNVFDTPHFWLLGTAPDTYLPSIILI